MVGYRRQLRPAIDFSINICAPQLFHTLLHLLHETLEAVCVCVCVCVCAFSLSLSLCVLYVCVCVLERDREILQQSAGIGHHLTSPLRTLLHLQRVFFLSFFLSFSSFFFFFLSAFLSFFSLNVMENYLSQIWNYPFEIPNCRCLQTPDTTVFVQPDNHFQHFSTA